MIFRSGRRCDCDWEGLTYGRSAGGVREGHLYIYGIQSCSALMRWLCVIV